MATELVKYESKVGDASGFLRISAGEFGMQGQRREFEDCSSVLLPDEFAQAAGTPPPTEVKTGRVTLPSATTGVSTTTTAKVSSPARIRAPTRLESDDYNYNRLESPPTSPEPPTADASSTTSSTTTSTAAVTASSDMGLPSLAKTHFFGIYDGHSGIGAAAFVRDDLSRRLAIACQKERLSAAMVKTAMGESDAAVCVALRQLKTTATYSAGTTLVVAALEEPSNKLFIANVGDSRAVLSAGGQVVFATLDHKPHRPEEKALVEKLGGRIGYTDAHSRGNQSFCCAPCWGCPCFKSYKRPWRVFPGGLAVSRTFGDVCKNEAQARVTSAEPDVTEITLEPKHDFLILACDGVWDVVTNQAAVDFIGKQRQMGFPAETAANNLCQLAYHKGSTDNISAVVVYFSPQRSA